MSAPGLPAARAAARATAGAATRSMAMRRALVAAALVLPVAALGLRARAVPAPPAAAGTARPARLTLVRDAAAGRHPDRRARVHLDDRPLASLRPGEAFTTMLPPGRHRLVVDLFGLPGHGRQTFELRPGDHLTLRVHEAAQPARDGGFAFGPGALTENPT